MDSFFRTSSPTVTGLRPEKKPAKEKPLLPPPLTVAPDVALNQAVRVLSGEANSLPKILAPQVLRALTLLQRQSMLIPTLEQHIAELEATNPRKANNLRFGLTSGRWALLFPF